METCVRATTKTSVYVYVCVLWPQHFTLSFACSYSGMFDWHVLARERCCAKGLFPRLHIHNVLLFTINTYAGIVTPNTICTRQYANEIRLSSTIHHSSILSILIPQISKSLCIFQSVTTWAKISVCPYLPFHFFPLCAFILDSFLLTFSLSSCDWSGDRAHCSVH